MFLLTISYQKLFVLSVSVLYSQICTLKLNLRIKISLTYTLSIVKRFIFFFNFRLRKYILLFFAEFELLMFHNNIVNISEKLNTRNFITKTRLFKFIENLFSDKNSDFVFHISVQNIDCGYSLEPPCRGGSNKYPQSMFLSRNKKNSVYPCKPQFYYIKSGV